MLGMAALRLGPRVDSDHLRSERLATYEISRGKTMASGEFINGGTKARRLRGTKGTDYHGAAKYQTGIRLELTSPLSASCPSGAAAADDSSSLGAKLPIATSVQPSC